jgi:hypothetical protein
VQVLEYHWKENAHDDETKKLQPNALYQPKISNLESGDAFCVLQCPGAPDGSPQYALIVLQITVGSVHPVKMNGLHDIVLSYPSAIQDMMIKKLLVFVTPPDGKLNSIQKLITKDGKDALHVPPAVQGFEQCVYRHKICL